MIASGSHLTAGPHAQFGSVHEHSFSPQTGPLRARDRAADRPLPQHRPQAAAVETAAVAGQSHAPEQLDAYKPYLTERWQAHGLSAVLAARDRGPGLHRLGEDPAP